MGTFFWNKFHREIHFLLHQFWKIIKIIDSLGSLILIKIFFFIVITFILLLNILLKRMNFKRVFEVALNHLIHNRIYFIMTRNFKSWSFKQDSRPIKVQFTDLSHYTWWSTSCLKWVHSEQINFLKVSFKLLVSNLL